MKKDFFDILDKVMEENKDVYLLMVGLGYPRTEEFTKKYPNRAINTEASEQTALDMAVGLAYAGKIPFVYTITPFLYRGFETIRTYINHENLHVVLIGAGRDEDYSIHDGFSHYAGDDKDVFAIFKNIQSHWPSKESLPIVLDWAVKGNRPYYINLTR